MTTEIPDDSVGTPLEGGANAIAYTAGLHYATATAADAGTAIAADAAAMEGALEPDYDVPGIHDVVDPESGVTLEPDDAIAVATMEGEGNTMVTPPE